MVSIAIGSQACLQGSVNHLADQSRLETYDFVCIIPLIRGVNSGT